MRCPVCDVRLVLRDRQGVEIDYCPQCRGVWLARGELDRLIERSSSSRSWRGHDDEDEERSPLDGLGRRRPADSRRRRRRGFLDDFFDFD